MQRNCMFLTCLWIGAAGPVAKAQSITPLPPLPGYAISGAGVLSGDGASIVGASGQSSPPFRITPTRWGASGGAGVPLSVPVEYLNSGVRALSGDGQIAVGSVGPGQLRYAARWNGSIFAQLPEPAGTTIAEAMSVSADGAVAVGWAMDSSGVYRALRWDGSGLVTLAPNARAFHVSADGSLIAGVQFEPGGVQRLVQWEGVSTKILATLPASTQPVELVAATPDQSVMAGYYLSESRIRSFIWSAGLGFTDMGALPGLENTSVNGISADGTMAVGRAHQGATRTAFVWTRVGGIQELSAYLPSRGVPLNGWTLTSASVIGAHVVVGSGVDPLTAQPCGVIITICYANCDGSTTAPTLNIADFACFLQKFAAGDPYANCDQSTTPPLLNVADFSCFLSQFAAGCP
jgi:uncharacterized membrane protein